MKRKTKIMDTLLLLDTAVVAQAGVFGYLITAIVTGGVLIGCAYFMKGVHIESFSSALILAVIVGAIVALAEMVFGQSSSGFISSVFSLVIGAGALIAGDKLMDTVKIDSIWWALGIAVVLALANGIVGTFGTL